ncbi:hypothetical protein ASPCADRAFT_8920 [Aspergillus carbonarius ITEM 5010]|uniref:Ankyrin repeat protein n=1 Tax=Aspergillus carbonarius (strain ITEM 5010) TaxID=602072 RepID=A0A1R3RC53_ASPC5|nr:hypothetical protein ASPCADRAFT_8920 [Aspergillus carbonarius ITEM 5010]
MPCHPRPFNEPIPDPSPDLLKLADEIREKYPGRIFSPAALTRFTKTNRVYYRHITGLLRRKSWIDAIPTDPTLPSQIGMLPSGKWNRRCNLSTDNATTIGLAIEAGDLQQVKALLRHTPINALDHKSNCLLHLALVANQIPIAELLLSKGAYPDGYHPSTIPELDQLFLSPENTGPQCPAIREQILHLLLRHQASISRFPTQNMLYITRDAPELLKFLISAHPETLDLRSASGHTLLHTAAALGCRHSCEFLVSRAPHLLAIDTDWDVTALHMAILEKNELNACWLITAGIHFHARSGFDRTELFLATAMRLPTVVSGG